MTHTLVTDAVEANAAAGPDRIAVATGGGTITYRELDERANRIAHHLLVLGVEPDVPVAVFLPRGRDVLPALLGVWKAGTAYVPLDTSLPKGRLAHMLGDSGAPIVLTDSTVADRLPGDARKVLLDRETLPATSTAPARRTDPEHLAYVIYTSGSTGNPKGVMVTQGALANLLRSIADDVLGGATGTWLASTSVSFDISALELYLPLLTGDHLVLAGDDEAKNPAALVGLITANAVTHVQATPSGWRLLLASGLDHPAITALVGGEALPAPLARQLAAKVKQLTNVYGPTETTIWSSYWPVPADADAVSLGRPLAGQQLHTLDHELSPAAAGELHIGGLGLARGYHNQPALTADRFVPDPFGPAGSRMYRTGDLTAVTGDTLAYHGRVDTQLKIRGYRIEAGEIESRLREHADVADAVVTVREPNPGDQRLTAHLVPVPGRRPDLAALRAHLARTLPDYMIPGTFMAIDHIPLNTSGKVDRAALPAPRRTRPETTR